MANISSGSRIEPISISVKDAAEALSVSTWQLYQILDEDPRPIDSRYIGSRRVVMVASLREYAAGLPTRRVGESA